MVLFQCQMHQNDIVLMVKKINLIINYLVQWELIDSASLSIQLSIRTIRD